MKKDQRVQVAKETLKILEQGFYYDKYDRKIDIAKQQQEAENHTVLYPPDSLLQLIENTPQPPHGITTTFEVNELSTLDSVRREYEQDENLICLNFASARNPGGGFLNGAQAQEESIARASGLYRCQLKAEGYYLANRKIRTCLYTDHIIYSPRVPVIRDEEGALLDRPVFTSIITAPAVNAGVVSRKEADRIDQIEPVMKRRMDMVLAICRKHGHQTLILGAWGCGVFQNDPVIIAGMFKELLTGKYKDQFAKVVFSVYSRKERFIRPFRAYFNQT